MHVHRQSSSPFVWGAFSSHFENATRDIRRWSPAFVATTLNWILELQHHPFDVAGEKLLLKYSKDRLSWATKYRKNDLRRTFFSLCMCEHCEGCLSELSSSYLRFIRLKLIFFSQFMKGFTVNLRIEHLQPNKRGKNEMEKVFSRIGPSIIILAAVSLNIVVKEPANRTEEAPSKTSWGY